MIVGQEPSLKTQTVEPHNGERAPMNITWSAVGSAPYGKQEVSDVTAVSRLQSADLASRWQASVGQLEQA
ncbi:hypothetical protein E1301_Tti023417 [Triplophysa tibetana]|uniref:Uncharacterized protein n=1 Tax=Triplophysa tibetana TaxID=1572043 RepID=A0A5A9N0W1_9TELE|nr:hypothetical protein E1301_Tti023417 [Triplophysa tibetana]